MNSRVITDEPIALPGVVCVAMAALCRASGACHLSGAVLDSVQDKLHEVQRRK